MNTIYGIHGNNNVMFLDLVAAEKYLYENYQEYMTSKEKCMEYSEEMIWEDSIIICEGCGDKILRDEVDEYWIRPSCCDQWYCHRDCHN
jgi:hypothetical protein